MDAKSVREECEKSVSKFKYPKKCEELIKYAKEQEGEGTK